MRKLILFSAVLFVFFSIQIFAQDDTEQRKAQNTQQQQEQQIQDDFISTAASGGRMEVELGQTAIDNAVSEEVKQFGKRMVQDHSKANEELMQIITQNDLNKPQDGMMEKHKEMVKDLSNKYGLDFDKAYMKAMVEDHTEDVEAFESASRNHQNEAVRGWAAKTLPVLKEHLELAKQINKMLQATDQQWH